jgi:restriction system protein
MADLPGASRLAYLLAFPKGCIGRITCSLFRHSSHHSRYAMAIPDFQTIMLPLLQYFSDKKTHSNQNTYEVMAERFRLTEEELSELLPSGKQSVFSNRVAWAKSHLKQAGLIESPERGVYRITERGLEVLRDAPERITISYLRKYPEFRRFRGERDTEPIPPVGANDEKTPQEHIEYGYQQIKEELTEEILKQVKACSPFYFEKIVVDLLLAMGYGGSRAESGQVTQKTGDGGIDGIINEDKLGLDVIYIQAKRWENPVSRPEIQKFAGALQGKRAKKGIFITTSSFSRESHEFARSIDSKIILIDGERLAKLMIEHNVGVVVGQTYEIKRMDSDYFIEA